MRIRRKDYLSLAIISVLVILTLVIFGCSKDPQTRKLAFMASGQHFMAEGKYDEASIQFRNAVKTDPRFVEAYFDWLRPAWRCGSGTKHFRRFSRPMSWIRRDSMCIWTWPGC